MNPRIPAEVFPPGEFLREELEAREWSQQELADILDRPPRLISEVIAGKRAITPETARGLSEAFGTSAEYWMNLESQYQLSKVRPTGDHVARKARLYSKFPVREMLRRGWVQASENLEVVEQRFCDFFNIANLDVEPTLSHAAKKTHATIDATPLQLAWLFRVKSMASQQKLPPYSKDKLNQALEKLKVLMVAPEESRHVPRIMAEAGVRLVFVEPISGSMLDGACFWLPDDRPVIGMTLRFDRIDNFWFVLRHEIEHVLNGDGKDTAVIDSNVGEAKDGLPESEVKANEAGANFCVPTAQLENFVARVQPYFSEQRVLNFAQRMNVHPGIVVGQLQRKLGRHDFLRKHQVRIRANVIPSADADGWGSFSE
ncbi:XRE family plasmid maintenance system antidote protein [Caballeronia choica]|jgi:HTH-type transcriptional regulator / antitoxin HigA|uniref:XRE family plasmid maintenance system antidote protein n=1 Tax=Caballeronia choica TaxID=326476 RepID=A0A158KYB3_9BURK|nr:HigA family addiction module antitoxin [Caballeronia choica]SAL85729.1 XRE family plasmid maintenance system antidote protein [Caballeronia choica]